MLRVLIFYIFLLHPGYLYSQWISQNSGILRHLYGLDVVDSNVVYCAAQLGINVKTTNGGLKWDSIPAPYIDDYSNCSFLNKDTGLIVGPGGVMVRTTNGGASWSIIFHQLSGLRNAQFVNQNWVYACGASGVIRSTNGGLNWYLLQNFNNGIANLYFTDSLNGTVVGTNGFIITTTNGGLNWTQRYMMLPVQFGDSNLYAIYYINSNSGFICGNNGIVVKTTNSGINWILLPTGTITALTSLWFIDNSTGFIAGNAGRIYKTSNGGLNWIQQNTGISDPLKDIEFINAFTGWVCGFNGRIMKTTNGGSTWINPIGNEIPNDIKLYQNYPNPFNSMTNLKWQVVNTGNVTIKIYDILGKEIETLVNEKLPSGTYEVSWDASNHPSGIYFYRLQIENYFTAKKMTLLK